MLSTQSDLMFLYFLFSKRINLLRFFSAMASATGLLRDLSAFYSQGLCLREGTRESVCSCLLFQLV